MMCVCGTVNHVKYWRGNVIAKPAQTAVGKKAWRWERNVFFLMCARGARVGKRLKKVRLAH